LNVPLSQVPDGVKVLGTRWVNSWKADDVRCRLVVQGCQQALDSTVDIFAATPSLVTLLTMITIAIAKNWTMSTGDVSTAFLHADLTEEVYVKPPPELIVPGHCWKLLKALYGLRSAPKHWSDHLADVLKNKLHFKRSKTDSCFYYHTALKIYALVYVDDIFLVTENDDQKDWFFEELVKYVMIRQTGVLTAGKTLKFLGRKLIHRGDHVLVKCLDGYITDVLALYNMEHCKGGNTTGTSLVKCPLNGDEALDWDGHRLYRTAVGKLIWLCTVRPDIDFAVKELSRAVQLPTEEDLAKMKHLLRYLKKTEHLSLQLKPTHTLSNDPTAPIEICSYGDTDWAGCRLTRKSTTGCVVQVLGCTVMHCVYNPSYCCTEFL